MSKIFKPLKGTFKKPFKDVFKDPFTGTLKGVFKPYSVFKQKVNKTKGK